jgi:hypothetical protein
MVVALALRALQLRRDRLADDRARPGRRDRDLADLAPGERVSFAREAVPLKR